MAGVVGFDHAIVLLGERIVLARHGNALFDEALGLGRSLQEEFVALGDGGCPVGDAGFQWIGLNGEAFQIVFRPSEFGFRLLPVRSGLGEVPAEIFQVR